MKKNSKLNMFIGTLALIGTLYNSASYGSPGYPVFEDLDDRIEQEKPSKPSKAVVKKVEKDESRIKSKSSGGPSFLTRAFIFGLLASVAILPVSAEPCVSAYCLPAYQELNLTNKFIVNYPQDIMYEPAYAPTSPNQVTMKVKEKYTIPSNLLYSIVPAYCRELQKKVERAWKIRHTCNEAYELIQSEDIPQVDKYKALIGPMQVELDSHRLEIEAYNIIKQTPDCLMPFESDQSRV